MPIARLGRVDLNFRVDGPDGAPWLVFCNSLGTELGMWNAQLATFAPLFRVLRYDCRGHGLSSTPAGRYSIADLGGDVIALMDQLDIETAAFCGLSIGGLTGQWLAVNAPDRFSRIVLCSTAARIGTEEGWRARIEQVETLGMSEVAKASIARWFTPGFAAAERDLVTTVKAQLQRTNPEGYIGCINALIDGDFGSSHRSIRVPVLALAGVDDPVTPPSDLRFIANGIPGARYAEIPGAHICNIESAASFNELVLGFVKNED